MPQPFLQESLIQSPTPCPSTVRSSGSMPICFSRRADSMRHIVNVPITLLILLSALIGCSTARSEVPQVANALTPESGVIAAGRLQPGDIAGLQQAGIRHVIDLTLDSETPNVDEAKLVQAAG